MTHDVKLNLRQRRIEVMKAVGYVRRGAAEKGTGVQRDVVVSEVRAKLLEHGVDLSTSQVGPGRYLENGKASSSGTPLCQYVAMYATTFVNVDDPSDTLTVQHEGQGNDFGDKAPGKAATYAEKLNLVKGLMLETGIAEESRNHGDGDDAGKGGGGGIGEEKLKNFSDSIAAATTPKQLTETWQMACKFINENGKNPGDINAVTEAASKRKGVLVEAKKKADAEKNQETMKTNAAGNGDAE
jgi:hypothetical protein